MRAAGRRPIRSPERGRRLFALGVGRVPRRGSAAIDRGDAKAVSNLYNLHVNGQNPEAPQRVTAETQVKPETVHQTPRTVSTPSVGRTIPESEIKAFYRNAAQKQIPEAEVKKMEAEFDLAADEGRIAFGR